MSQCHSPQDILDLIAKVFNSMINEYLLCGVLQGGLKACNEDAYLPRDTTVVLCRQLYELVQEGIDTGKIVAPTVVEMRYEETTLILHLANGENLSLDLKELVDNVINQAFVDCNGEAISVGDKLATCKNLEDVQHLLEDLIEKLNHKVDDLEAKHDTEIGTLEKGIQQEINKLELLIEKNKELSDQADQNLEYRMDEMRTAIIAHVDAMMANYVNEVMKELLELYMETRIVYHDDSMYGDGHEAAPLGVDVEWLRDQIKQYLPDAIEFTDCCGEKIPVDAILVTCECLDTQLKALTIELKAYAEKQAAEALEDAMEYTDVELEKRVPSDAQDGQVLTRDPNGNNIWADGGGSLTSRDTTSVDLEGKGTATAPLIANVNISKASGNMLLSRGDGLAVFPADPPPDVSRFYVDPDGGDDAAVGTRAAPLKTIAQALQRLSRYGSPSVECTIYTLATATNPSVMNDGVWRNLSGTGKITVRSYGDPVFDGVSSDAGYSWWKSAEATRPRVLIKWSRNDENGDVQKTTIGNFGEISFVGIELEFESNFHNGEFYAQKFTGNRWFIPNAGGQITYTGVKIIYRGNTNHVTQAGGATTLYDTVKLDQTDMIANGIIRTSGALCLVDGTVMVNAFNGSNQTHNGDENRPPYTPYTGDITTQDKSYRTWSTSAAYDEQRRVVYGFIPTWNIYAQDGSIT